jgi:diguanylate cyclase (GGDEF)-like protein
MLDIDGLQQLNKRHGISFGDRVIRALSNLLVSQCRSEEVVSHCGGGQFAILVPGRTRAGANLLADRLCAQIASQLRHHSGKEVGLSCSFGVADCAVSGNLSVIERAEQALLRAKLNGGACISIARPLRKEASRAA